MNEFYVITRTLYSEELLRETYYLQVRKLWEEFNLDWNSKKNTKANHKKS